MEGRGTGVLQRGQRMRQRRDLVAHGARLELLDLVEALELGDRRECPVEREASERELLGGQLGTDLRTVRRGLRPGRLGLTARAQERVALVAPPHRGPMAAL